MSTGGRSQRTSSTLPYGDESTDLGLSYINVKLTQSPPPYKYSLAESDSAETATANDAIPMVPLVAAQASSAVSPTSLAIFRPSNSKEKRSSSSFSSPPLNKSNNCASNINNYPFCNEVGSSNENSVKFANSMNMGNNYLTNGLGSLLIGPPLSPEVVPSILYRLVFLTDLRRAVPT